MTYDVQSWTRCISGSGETLRGEEALRMVRVRHFEHVRKVMHLLMHDFSVCRVTLTRPGSATVWDLYRYPGRDVELDNSLRPANEAITTSVVQLDIGPGVRESDLAAAVAEMLTTKPT